MKGLLPEALRNRLGPAYHGLQRLRWTLYCPVCERRVPSFLPLPSSILEQFSKHGSDLRFEDFETLNFHEYSCPHCGASDRDRLFALYLNTRLGRAPSESFRLLEIAPTIALSQHIRQRYQMEHRTADLNMQGVDDRIDLTRMDCYPDNSFDAFICSHVLEHVSDDRTAMSELFRILKPAGWGIVMVPIDLSNREIREDLSKTTEAQRWKYFGQGDHVRLYNRVGFLDRLRKAGFKTKEIGADFFGKPTFARCGITDQSVLYVAEK